MFYARLDQLCKEAGVSVAMVAETVLHVSSGTPTGWKKGASPKAATVEIAARYFGVSADYLLGLTSEKKALPGARALDEGETRLIDALRSVPEDVRRAVMRMAESALLSQPQSPAGNATPGLRLIAGSDAPRRTSAPDTRIAAEAETRPLPPARSDAIRPRRTDRTWKGVEGRAAAGPPITAVPEDERRILVPVKFTGEQYFIVQAEGDSMASVIGDGDYCVFNKRGTFDNGQIALVQVDGPTDQPDATIKHVYRRPGGKVELRSENPKYPPMLYPAEEVVLMGELVAVLPQDTAMN